jgi:hypothetical protein
MDRRAILDEKNLQIGDKCVTIPSHNQVYDFWLQLREGPLASQSRRWFAPLF